MKLLTIFVGFIWIGQLAAQGQKTPQNDKQSGDTKIAKSDAKTMSDSEKIEILAQEIEQLKAGKELFQSAGKEGKYGLGPAASKVYSVEKGVSLGGYGEFLYQRFARKNESGNDSGQNDRFDALRNILYAGYKFSDKIVFNSEIEFEHAGKEVAVEFATLDFLLDPRLNFKAGLMLLPIGIYNEMHEAPTFLATTRPLTEQRLIPTTWRENGAGLFGQMGDFAYKLYGVTSLDAKNNNGQFSSQGIRKGRQSGEMSTANEFSGILRIDYVGLTGSLFGVSGYWGKSGQADAHEHETTLLDVHADFRFKGVYFRTVAVWSRITGADQLAVNGVGVADQMFGAYAEFGYDLLRFFGTEQELYPHIRVEKIDTQYKVAAGNRFDAQYEQSVLTFGLAYKPIHQISAKVDYSFYSNKADRGVNQLNFALGYLF